jgi:Chromosome segregation ATPases
MKRIRSLAAVAVLSIVILFLIASHAGTPVLYNPESDAVTPYHTNPAALEKVSGDNAERLLPIMSDLLNTPGTLVLNLKYNDLDLASKDLAKYRELTRSIDNLVINLDMSGTEVEQFQKMNQKNLQILSELFNETSRFEELRTLEIRYKDENDPAILTSITYEGQSLRNRVRQLYNEYQLQEEPLVEVSSDFELNTTHYEESQTDFAEIVRTVEQVQTQRTNELQSLPGSASNHGTLGISVTPSEGIYNTVLMISGLYSGADTGHTQVEIFIDSEKEAEIITDLNGYYQYSYTLRDMPEGLHTLFAVAETSVYSDITGFNVKPLDTKLTLLPPERSGGKYICSGSFTGVSGEPLTNTALQVVTDKKYVSMQSRTEKVTIPPRWL